MTGRMQGPFMLAGARRAVDEARAAVALVRAGAFGLDTPRRVPAVARILRADGPGGAITRAGAILHGDRTAIVDDAGRLSYRELDAQVDAAANGFRALGLAAGDAVGILCANGRTPFIASFGASRAGLDVVLLNTSFSARQAREVALREGIDLLVHDDDLADVAAGVWTRCGSLATSVTADGSFEAFLGGADRTPVPAPARPGRTVLLTSGTTGTPKGARRPESRSLLVPGGLFARMPLRARGTAVVGPPVFHGTGLSFSYLSLSLGSTLVMRRRFDAERFLDDLADHRAAAACVVPIMLQRVLALGDEAIGRRDLRALRVLYTSGSLLPVPVALEATRLLGDVIYNMYGSTEAFAATMTTPEDVRAAPASVGRPLLGSRVRILDAHGREVPAGVTGRIFVGTVAAFEGYTGGGDKERIDGLVSTGDLGHFDGDGRLHVDGRDDDMIVSGGENVFPREVEDVLVEHPAVLEASVVGVADTEFGERLRAFVVLRDGASATPEELRLHVRENLARYKVPRDVLFLDELPRNATGKVLRRTLAAADGRLRAGSACD